MRKESTSYGQRERDRQEEAVDTTGLAVGGSGEAEELGAYLQVTGGFRLELQQPSCCPTPDCLPQGAQPPTMAAVQPDWQSLLHQTDDLVAQVQRGREAACATATTHSLCKLPLQ